jgi:hypothetical protein
MLAIRLLRPAVANWSLRIQYGWLSDWHRISTPSAKDEEAGQLR